MDYQGIEDYVGGSITNSKLRFLYNNIINYIFIKIIIYFEDHL